MDCCNNAKWPFYIQKTIKKGVGPDPDFESNFHKFFIIGLYIIFMEKFLEVMKERKYLVGGIVVVAVVVGLFLLSLSSENPQPEVLGIEDEFVEEGEEESVCDVFADISGAVEVPGVYCLEFGSKINDLVKLAGGFRDDHCEVWVERELNRAGVVGDGLKIYIPNSKDSECQSNEEISKITETGKVSLNSSSQDDLETLPGIGPALSSRIINNRPFTKLEDIKNVQGIGDSLYGKILSLIAL